MADYFEMLRLELLGEPYNKSEHRRRLLPHLKGRTQASIELKHANISAVLFEMGIPFIDGYKPRKNYQRNLLPDAVRAYLAGHPEVLACQRLAPPTASKQLRCWPRCVGGMNPSVCNRNR